MMWEQCAACPVWPRVVQEKTTLRNAKTVQILFLYQVFDNIEYWKRLLFIIFQGYSGPG